MSRISVEASSHNGMVHFQKNGRNNLQIELDKDVAVIGQDAIDALKMFLGCTPALKKHEFSHIKAKCGTIEIDLNELGYGKVFYQGRELKGITLLDLHVKVGEAPRVTLELFPMESLT